MKRGLNELTNKEIQDLAKATLAKKIANKEWVDDTKNSIYTRDK